MAELRGQIKHQTDKALFFHQYGTKAPVWYPKSRVYSEDRLDNGTVVIEVDDWIYQQKVRDIEPGDFREPPLNHPELPLDIEEPADSDTYLSIAHDTIVEMSDGELLEHFDEVVAMLQGRGIDIDKHYGEQNETED